MNPQKHVIFLGAGASMGSGYPNANQLRLMMSSPDYLERHLVKYEDANGLPKGSLGLLARAFFERFRAPLDLFRFGGFGTVDEFGYLAREHGLAQEVGDLKLVLRSVLGICNPEMGFHNSEYYPFLQRLFEKDLISLRGDISIISYNYDPYLEFLLLRALRTRLAVAKKEVEPLVANDVTGGFLTAEDQTWARVDESQNSFCVLKPHGSMAFPGSSRFYKCGYEDLFNPDPRSIGDTLFGEDVRQWPAPVAFPWEVHSESASLDDGNFTLGVNLLPLFRFTWNRAMREVQRAEKISFVGLSMHHYLEAGLKRLFQGKTGQVEIVIANPENTEWAGRGTVTHWSDLPQSPGANLRKMLSNVAPGLVPVGRLERNRPATGEFTLRKNFWEFISKDLYPIVEPLKVV